MRPKSMPSALKTSTLPPLPPNKTLIQVFADFFAYLLFCAEKFIKETHATVVKRWDDLLRNAVFVIGHPNGWEGTQQSMLRKAAILGGLAPDTPEGRARVKFVSEGEASLHFCLREGVVEKDKKGFIIADLGGGTLDFSAYQVTGVKPLQAEEVAAAICNLEGSTLVTMRAQGYITHKLRNSIYGATEHVKQIAQCFDESTKKTFRSEGDVCLVPFGSLADKDLENGIRSGKLKLTGTEVASFFAPAVKATVEAVLQQMRESKIPIAMVYLVGGFSANPYVTTQLKQQLAKHKVSVASPDGQTAKAVADGALSFYLDQFVALRIAKISYGTKYHWKYDPSDNEHKKRSKSVWTRPSGEKLIKGGFRTVLKRGTSVSKETEFRSGYGGQVTKVEDIDDVKLDVRAFYGSGTPPEWMDLIEKKHIRSLCTVSVDKSIIKNIAQKSTNKSGSAYWWYNYDLIINFGGTEMTAQILWNEGTSSHRIERRSTAQIVYDEPVLEDDEPEEYSEDWFSKMPPARDVF